MQWPATDSTELELSAPTVGPVDRLRLGMALSAASYLAPLSLLFVFLDSALDRFQALDENYVSVTPSVSTPASAAASASIARPMHLIETLEKALGFSPPHLGSPPAIPRPLRHILPTSPDPILQCSSNTNDFVGDSHGDSASTAVQGVALLPEVLTTKLTEEMRAMEFLLAALKEFHVMHQQASEAPATDGDRSESAVVDQQSVSDHSELEKNTEKMRRASPWLIREQPLLDGDAVQKVPTRSLYLSFIHFFYNHFKSCFRESRKELLFLR